MLERLELALLTGMRPSLVLPPGPFLLCNVKMSAVKKGGLLDPAGALCRTSCLPVPRFPSPSLLSSISRYGCRRKVTSEHVPPKQQLMNHMFLYVICFLIRSQHELDCPHFYCSTICAGP